MESKYRKCVGMMILNKEKKILVARRLDHPSGFWQMPQGGIDEKEKPEEAVWREMMEEIGTNNAKLVATSTNWYNYNIPKEVLKTLPWGNEYIGQTQKWFLFCFQGKESEINVKTPNPEFSEWKWINHSSLLENVVPFKKKIYLEILEEFKNVF